MRDTGSQLDESFARRWDVRGIDIACCAMERCTCQAVPSCRRQRPAGRVRAKVASGERDVARSQFLPQDGSTLSDESALEVAIESTTTAARPHELPFPEPEGRGNQDSAGRNGPGRGLVRLQRFAMRRELFCIQCLPRLAPTPRAGDRAGLKAAREISRTLDVRSRQRRSYRWIPDGAGGAKRIRRSRFRPPLRGSG